MPAETPCTRLGHTCGVEVRRSVQNATVLMVAGVALAGGGAAVLLWPSAEVTAEVGSALVAPAGPTPALVAPAEPTAAGASVGSGSPTALASSGFVPERLMVEALDIDAPLTATVVDADRALVPPEDPAQLAWWRGVRPGEGAGSVLVAGHLDARRYGQGPLARIVQLEPGSQAVLTGADGSIATYILRGVTTIDKEALPAAELFGSVGPERLVLVTCGGTFDRDQRSWDSNVVAVFDPVRTG